MHKQDEASPKLTGGSKRLKWGLVAFALASLILLAWFWSTVNKPEVSADLPKYTRQEIQKAVKIFAGMTKPAVVNLLGEPAVKEFSNADEEWHYCTTGKVVDEYIAVSFQDNKVVALQYYTVSNLDTALHYGEQIKASVLGTGGWGDCRLGVRWGTYNQKTPDAPESHASRKQSPSPATSAPSGK